MEQCMAEKMGMQKPPFGYFTQLRIHETERPKPKSFGTEFKNANVGVQKDFEEEIEKLGPKTPYFTNL